MKDKIIVTALQQFLEHGIRNITIQKLVLPLAISTKTLYKYFSNKEELLEECLKVHYNHGDKWLKDLTEQTPEPVIALTRVYAKVASLDFGTNSLFYYDLNHYYPELQDKVIRKYSSNSLELITGIIHGGITEGDFLPHLQPPVVLEALTVLYTSVTRSAVFNKYGLTPAELIKHTVEIYLRGICTGKGLKILNQYNQSLI